MYNPVQRLKRYIHLLQSPLFLQSASVLVLVKELRRVVRGAVVVVVVVVVVDMMMMMMMMMNAIERLGAVCCSLFVVHETKRQ